VNSEDDVKQHEQTAIKSGLKSTQSLTHHEEAKNATNQTTVGAEIVVDFEKQSCVVPQSEFSVLENDFRRGINEAATHALHDPTGGEKGENAVVASCSSYKHCTFIVRFVYALGRATK
jgi:hypothetical protein